MVDCQREQVRNENRKILSQRRDFDKSTVVFVKVDGDGFMTLPMMFDVFFDYSSPAIMSFKIENKIRADRGQSVPLCAANSFVSFEHIILIQRGTDMILVQYDRIANSLYLHPWGKIRLG